MGYKDKEKLKEYKRRYYQENKEVCLARFKKWRLLHPEKVRAISQKYRQGHKEEAVAYAKRYWKTPIGIYNGLKHNRAEIKISREEFIDWYQSQKKKCSYCGIPEKIISKKRNFSLKKRGLTIDRKDNSKSYEKDNLALACPRCNIIKSNFFSYEEMRKLAKKFISSKW